MKITKIFLAITLLFSSSCSKDWLEEKQSIKLIVPTTLQDMDLLMNGDIFLYDGRGAMETSCDDYDFTLEQFNQLGFAFDRDFITWKKQRDIENLSLSLNEWTTAYNQIQICNVVLKGLKKITRSAGNQKDYDRIRGAALYFRAKQFLNLAMSFCNYYDENTAKNDLGIPLKLDDEVDEQIVRTDLEKTYQQIIADLNESASLLPPLQRDYTEVEKGGAYGMLARAYLYMNKYEQAKRAADSSLKYHPFVQDFNQIPNPTSTRPLNIQSKEIHVRGQMIKASPNPTTGRINTGLYSQYADDDLRKTYFFRNETDGRVTFKGFYHTNGITTTTTGEILLISAECKARLGDKAGAMEMLNALLIKRWKTGKFIPFSAQTEIEALDIVLTERRKELLTRGLRWQDLKRLNKDPRYARTLTRTIGSETYTLPPNDLRYALPIPQFVILYNGMKQNPY